MERPRREENGKTKTAANTRESVHDGEQLLNNGVCNSGSERMRGLNRDEVDFDPSPHRGFCGVFVYERMTDLQCDKNLATIRTKMNLARTFPSSLFLSKTLVY